MALDEFFGCLLTSFGIPFVLLVYTIMLYPLRIITLITSATFWLASLLVSSILWYAVVPLRSHLAFSLVFSVIFQEFMRLLFVYVLHKVDRGIKSLNNQVINSPNSYGDRPGSINNGTDNELVNGFSNTLLQEGNLPLVAEKTDLKHKNLFNVTTFAYVGGLGFGIIAGLFASMDLLRSLTGPGTLGLNGQSENFVSLYAFQVLFVVLIHTSFGVIMSRAYQKKSFISIVILVAIHMTYSCLTLLNSLPYPAPIIVIVLNALICFACFVWAFFEADGHIKQLPKVIQNGVNYIIARKCC